MSPASQNCLTTFWAFCASGHALSLGRALGDGDGLQHPWSRLRCSGRVSFLKLEKEGKQVNWESAKTSLLPSFPIPVLCLSHPPFLMWSLPPFPPLSPAFHTLFHAFVLHWCFLQGRKGPSSTKEHSRSGKRQRYISSLGHIIKSHSREKAQLWEITECVWLRTSSLIDMFYFSFYFQSCEIKSCLLGIALIFHHRWENLFNR